MIRLDKFLANQNIGSRKEVSTLVRKGAVAVCGVVVKKSDIKINPNTDVVTVNGERVEYKEFIYIMMNKPQGVLSATEDGKGTTVIDIVPDEWKRKDIFPAGRLDRNTTGLLIITDDGNMAHKMLAPKNHIFKIYRAILDEPVTDEDINKFKNGISTETADFLPAELWLENPDNPYEATVKIREGKFHQVKRMFAYCGKNVLELKRLSIGGLKLDDNLVEGESRLLTEEEINSVFLVNLH